MTTAATSTDSTSDWGTFVRTLRTARNISLSGLANRAGVAKSTLSRWEAGRALPRLAELESLLGALDASPDQRRRALEMIDAPRALIKIREVDRHVASQADADMVQAPAVGDLLRAMRVRRGRTVEEIARALGVSARSVRAWEHSDAWPVAEHLHSLCRLLDAAPSEVTALTAGNSWMNALDPLPATVSLDTLDQIGVYREELLHPSGGYSAEAERIKDLAYLALLARLVPLASQYPAARAELLNTYAGYATWLSLQHRLGEAGRYAERALEMKNPKGPQAPEWFRAAVISSHATVHGGRHSSMAAAIRVATPLLESILPIAATDSPQYGAWILSKLASLDYHIGQETSALDRVIQAREIAMTLENPREYYLRCYDQARMLVRLGRADEALLLIPPELPTYHAPQRGAERLLRAEALLQLGQLSEAHDWLGKAYATHYEHNLELRGAHEVARKF